MLYYDGIILSSAYTAVCQKTAAHKAAAVSRGDYKVAEMIGQKPSIVILSLNLVRHPYIALEC